MVCENCPYKLNLGNDLGDLGFKCGLDYCIHECRLFDCLAEENEKSHQRQYLDQMEKQLREEIAENIAEIKQNKTENDKCE